MIGSEDDDLLMGQLRQHATYIAAPGAEHLRQAFFRKATGRMNALFENGVEDSRIEILHRQVKGQGSEGLR
jgi:hypothetical protein